MTLKTICAMAVQVQMLLWIKVFYNKLWHLPDCTGGSDGQVGPSPRAFHVAVVIDCHMFIFGGHSGSKRYGGWDGKKWLSDVYVLDTISLEWMELSVTGSLPPPRCGHTTTMVEKRLLVYGGRGGAGPVLGDLWALKGLIEEENETPAWTQLKLPGQAPSARCGHTVTSGGHYLLLFGGHGTGGWLSRYDIYHNDCIVLDRVSAQWKRLPTGNKPPPARAYHSLTCMGSRYLLFGGFDGKSTFGDLWWLVPEEDSLAKRLLAASPNIQNIQNKDVEMGNENVQNIKQESQMEESAVSELQKRLGISVSLLGNEVPIVDEVEDKEFIQLASNLVGERVFSNEQVSDVQALRDHWRKSTPRRIPLKELGPLLRDYQRLITRRLQVNGGSDMQSVESRFPGKAAYGFYHIRNVNQLRLDDIPKLLAEYKQLVPN